jgi:H+-transporting ATPase
MDRLTVQTLMYLKLSVAGHLTIFLTRTRGPFWSIRPAKTLLIAVLGTQTVATLIAVYGLFMAPLGWKWAGFVWAYALVWALLNDRVKLLAYKIFDPVKAEAKPTVEAGAKADAKSAPRTEVKTPPDLAQQIARRAYEIFEHREPHAGTAVQDWQRAEREIKKYRTNGHPKPEAKTGEPKPEVGAEPKPEAKAKPRSDVSPQLVNRVHEHYEEPGRKGVQAVRESEDSGLETEKHEVHK